MALPYYKNIDLGLDISSVTQLFNDVKNHDIFPTNTAWFSEYTRSTIDPNDDTVNWYCSLGYTVTGDQVFPYFVDNTAIITLYEKFKHCCDFWAADIDLFYSCTSIRQCTGRNNLPCGDRQTDTGTYWLAIPVEITPGYENIYMYDAPTADANLIETITTTVGQPYFLNMDTHWNWQPQSEASDPTKVRKEVIVWFPEECGTMEDVINSFNPDLLSD